MITLLRFATRRSGVDLDRFAVNWRQLGAEVASAPTGVRPVRAAVATTVPGVVPGQRHDGVLQCWFDDADHLARYEAWAVAVHPLFGPGSADVADPRPSRPWADVVDRDRSPAVVAEVRVVRGEDWLARRWADGGARFKHMAVAVRAAGLTPAEFSDAWAGRSGTVAAPGGTGTVTIPDDVKGLAYVQDHPVPRDGGGWPYDAVNEVYLEDEAALRRRQAWFDQHLDQLGEAALFGDRRFLALVEAVQ